MIDKEQEQLDLKRDKKIEIQVEKWDVFARITPTVFLIISIILLFFLIIPYVKYLDIPIEPNESIRSASLTQSNSILSLQEL